MNAYLLQLSVDLSSLSVVVHISVYSRSFELKMIIFEVFESNCAYFEGIRVIWIEEDVIWVG